MTDGKETVIIQDEAKFSRSMDIWWFAHTEGKITVLGDGTSAIIQRNGIVLYAEIVTDSTANAKFTAMAAVSLDENYVGDTDPNDKYLKDNVEKSRDGITKLCIAVEGVTELRLAVAFTVIATADEIPQLGTVYDWKNISEWVAE